MISRISWVRDRILGFKSTNKIIKIFYFDKKEKFILKTENQGILEILIFILQCHYWPLGGSCKSYIPYVSNSITLLRTLCLYPCYEPKILPVNISLLRTQYLYACSEPCILPVSISLLRTLYPTWIYILAPNPVFYLYLYSCSGPCILPVSIFLLRTLYSTCIYILAPNPVSYLYLYSCYEPYILPVSSGKSGFSNLNTFFSFILH